MLTTLIHKVVHKLQQVSFLSENFSSLASIKTLTLNMLEDEDREKLENIDLFINLEELRLTNQIVTLPKELTTLSKLKKLHVSCIEGDLPVGLTTLPSLEEISITKIIRLKSNEGLLDLLENRTKIFVEMLSLEDVTIPYLDERIGKLSSLTGLFIEDNGLTELPDSLWNLSSLEHLSLANNGLTSFPEGVYKLRKLQTLNLSYNHITTLPNTICKLNEMTELIVSHNHLESLPYELGKLSNLKELLFSDNYVEEIPHSVAYLHNLEVMGLKKNEITVLPDWLKERDDIKLDIYRSHQPQLV